MPLIFVDFAVGPRQNMWMQVMLVQDATCGEQNMLVEDATCG